MAGGKASDPLFPTIVVAAVVEQDGAFLVTRRVRGVHLEGYWEFPGGKCEAGETHEECLRREIREELNVEVAVRHELLTTVHAYDDRAVELHFYQCTIEGAPEPRLGQEIRWVPGNELRTLEFPPADEALIALLNDANRS